MTESLLTEQLGIAVPMNAGKEGYLSVKMLLRRVLVCSYTPCVLLTMERATRL